MARKINLNWDSENSENCWVPRYSPVPGLNLLIKKVSIGAIRELEIKPEGCFMGDNFDVPLEWHVFSDCEMLKGITHKISYEFTRGISLCKKCQCQQHMDIMAEEALKKRLL